MRAVVYARFSSHNQREESIEGQLRECKEFANKNDLLIVNEYIDRAISGKTDHRPSFQRMIRDSEKHQFDAVIMYTLDRFARNRYDSAIYKAKLKKNGVKIYYAKQPMPDTPEGIILESVLEGYAEYYSENLARGIKRGMKDNALQGLVTGSPPLGYKIVNKEYVIEPIEAKSVKMIFEMYARGSALNEIVDKLNDSGCKTRYGHKFNKCSLPRILKNEKYIGTYKYEDIILKDRVPKIVSDELFKAVQYRLQHNPRARNKAKYEYLLSSKVYCGICGQPIIGESGTSSTGKIYRYYKCTGRKNGLGCQTKPVAKEVLEHEVFTRTMRRFLTDRTINKVAKETMKIVTKELQDNSALRALQDELQDVSAKISNLMSAIEAGIFTNSTKQRLEELENRKANVIMHITNEEMKKPALTEQSIIAWLNLFKEGKLTSKIFKQKLVTHLVNAIYLTDCEQYIQVSVVYNLGDGANPLVPSSDLYTVAPPTVNQSNVISCVKHSACLLFCINKR